MNRHFDGPTHIDLTIKVPKEGEQTDTSYVISFDMDVSYFDQTNYIEPKYENGKRKKFKKVLVVDQHNAKEGYHYISLFAAGIGLINQGKDELLFLWKEKIKSN